MKIVITYGTYDFLHEGHIKLLERAKALGDYLIVGVTSNNFDKLRGKINVQQTLIERIEGVKSLGIADKIIVEEYEGQKIDDIKKYGVDIFTVGDDWKGQFDYLNEYCQVIYLPRTKGISSSDIRSEKSHIRMGLVGDSVNFLSKFQSEDKYVNGLNIIGICTNNIEQASEEIKKLPIITNDYNELLKSVDAVYIKSDFENRYKLIKKALNEGKNVLCGSPITLNKRHTKELFNLADKKGCVLMDSTRTAYSTAYERLLLLIKIGIIGNVRAIDATCTSLSEGKLRYDSLYEWGANALLPIFQILGIDYKSKLILTHKSNGDEFTRINFVYKNAVASITVAEGAKSEGQLIITGTKGYILVPSPWWKTDYFEVKYENQNDNRRYFYQLDGEGIRYSLLAFTRQISTKKENNFISRDVSSEICKIMEDFDNQIDLEEI